MAEAALKYDFEPSETLLIPEGGLATFLTATEGAWADEKPFPQNGIAQVTRIADRLAEYGRHEDEYMIHAAEGETVIPMNVLDANPRLRKNLFAQMEMMGLEPERYVVGNELNSINPVTGQPEFFIHKKIHKILKKVVKVVKKALPIILPIVLSFTPLGPIWGAALGSGIGTLVQGGDFQDALKSAAFAAAIGGLTQGVKGGFNRAEGQTFGQGFKSGVKTAGGNIGERFGQAFGGPRPAGAPYFGAPGRPILSPQQAQAAAAAQAPILTAGPPPQIQAAGPPPQIQAAGPPPQIQAAGPLRDFQGRVIGAPGDPYGMLQGTDELNRALVTGQRLPGQGPGIQSQLLGPRIPPSTLDLVQGTGGAPPRITPLSTELPRTFDFDEAARQYYQGTNIAPIDTYSGGLPTTAGLPITGDPSIPAITGDSSITGGLQDITTSSTAADAARKAAADKLALDQGTEGWWQKWRARTDRPVADWMIRGGDTKVQVAEATLEARNTAITDRLAQYGYDSLDAANKAMRAGTSGAAQAVQEAIFMGEAAASAAGPSYLTRFGPSLALGTAGAAGMGLFDQPEVDDEEKTQEEIDEMFRRDPQRLAELRINYGPTPQYQIRPVRIPGISSDFNQPISVAAQGGGIGSLESSDFPRRSGRIAGPGTGRSDDVPAMLSDGEFVMTAKAVRGAGNGNRNNGMSNMYQLMRNFEGSA